MPAKAPCVEVAEEVEAQGKIVRVVKLMSELAAATRAPPRRHSERRQVRRSGVADREREARVAAHALNVVRGVLKNIREQKTPRGAGQKHDQGLGENGA